jgi:hypothetical protein
MHASLWHFAGDPDDLARRYEAMLDALPPGAVQLQLCLRAEDGIVLVDTCPDRAAFESFAASDDFRALREHHGMPAPDRIEDFPVLVATVDGRRRP